LPQAGAGVLGIGAGGQQEPIAGKARVDIRDGISVGGEPGTIQRNPPPLFRFDPTVAKPGLADFGG
jgi:hypothetical protein